MITCVFQVHLQTQQKGNIGLIKMGVKVFKNDGIMGLYNGLSASLLRQVIWKFSFWILVNPSTIGSLCALFPCRWRTH